MSSSLIWIPIIIALVFLAVGILLYILEAVSLQTLAKRRKIAAPWLAWIPFVSAWLEGRLVKQYDERNGQKRHWDYVLLTLMILMVGLVIACIATILDVVDAADLIDRIERDGVVTRRLLRKMEAAIITMVIATYANMFLAIIFQWVRSLCLYKIFESTVPKRALTYTILCLICPIARPLCLLSCKDKGYDLLPKAPIPTAPVYTPPVAPPPVAPTPVAQSAPAQQSANGQQNSNYQQNSNGQ